MCTKNDYNEVNKVYSKYFKNDPPAREAVEVSKLPKDFHFPNIEIPILLNIENLPCNGAIIGDLNQDQVWNVLDVILMINIILSGTNDECEFYLSDLNSDETINVLDVVFLINLILDE